MFGRKSGGTRYDGRINGEGKHGENKNPGEQGKGIIDRLTDKPRGPTFISIFVGCRFCAVGITVNLNVRLRYAGAVGNVLFVAGILVALGRPWGCLYEIPQAKLPPSANPSIAQKQSTKERCSSTSADNRAG